MKLCTQVQISRVHRANLLRIEGRDGLDDHIDRSVLAVNEVELGDGICSASRLDRDDLVSAVTGPVRVEKVLVHIYSFFHIVEPLYQFMKLCTPAQGVYPECTYLIINGNIYS